MKRKKKKRSSFGDFRPYRREVRNKSFKFSRFKKQNRLTVFCGGERESEFTRKELLNACRELMDIMGYIPDDGANVPSIEDLR